MSKRVRILLAANKRLPDGDYRIAYGARSRAASVVYGLPGRPESLATDQFVKLDFREGLAPRDAGSFLALIRHLRDRRHEYDLVHFFSTKLQLLGPRCAALAGVPCVNTITGFGRTFNRRERRFRLLRPIYLRLLSRSLDLARATFFQNHGDMQWLAERLPQYAHKMHWIGSGVDAEAVQLKDFHSRPLVVLMVSRLMPDKGVPVFLEAARRLHGPEFRFVLVGPASVGQDALYRRVLETHQQGAIEYLGELGSWKLAAAYRQSHVFAFPSCGEGMPRVMLEAGHALVCPVASDIPAHRDLVATGSGFLLDASQETDSLVSHLRRLNDDRALLEANARAYQRHIVSSYTVEAYTRRMDDFLPRLSLAATSSSLAARQTRRSAA